jgi:hypothetical protein
MDRWLNNAPALVCVKDISTWLVLNNNCEPIMWTVDNSEVTFYLACLDCVGNEQAKTRLVRKMRRKATTQLLDEHEFKWETLQDETEQQPSASGAFR